MIDHYDWPGGREAMLRFGPAGGPVVVAALPLFEEANRTRAFVVTILRGLAERGIASAVPDLPGTGESLVPTAEAGLAAMREAFAAVPGDYTLAIRSGALLDAGARKGRWQLSPQPGADLVRELDRLRQVGASGDYGGNLLSPGLLAELEGAEAGTARVVRLESDSKPADRKAPGAPLWRRAEPDNDPALAALLADDIATWVRGCEG
ncbi:MAG: hypothetical protein V4574_18215 [Pseudomonadota bacterium]